MTIMHWNRSTPPTLANYVSDDVGGWIQIEQSLYDLGRDYQRKVAVLYETLRRRNINYSLEAATSEHRRSSQPIRSIDLILHAPGEGTCIDLALLFAGLCLHHAMLPLVVIFRDHAFVCVSMRFSRNEYDAFHREEKVAFAEGILTDRTILAELVARGEYIAIECTGFAYSKTLPGIRPEGRGRVDGFLSFERAMDAGREYLQSVDYPFEFALDIEMIRNTQPEIKPVKMPRGLYSRPVFPPAVSHQAGSPATLYAPDMGLDAPTPAPPLLAYLEATEAMNPLRFDLGTCWALSRGSFIGIVADSTDSQLYTGLLKVERTLWDVSMSADARSFPTRWWNDIDPQRALANGPDLLHDLWRFARNPHDRLIEHLQAQGPPMDSMPGIFMRLPVALCDSSLYSKLVRWCARLADHTLTNAQCAFVYQITGGTLSEVLPRAQELRSRLCNIQPLPVEIVILTEDGVNRPQAASQASGARGLGLLAIAAPSGSHLCSWIQRAAEHMLDYEELAFKHTYPLLFDSYQSCMKTVTADPPSQISAFALVRDVDHLWQARGESADRQLLSLIKRHLPMHFPELIRAYASSERPSARRQAFIAAQGSDQMIDCWVAGAVTSCWPPLEIQDLGADEEHGPLLTDLVLGLLRYYSHHPQISLKAYIEQLAQYDRHLTHISSLCLSGKAFHISTTGTPAQELMLAARAGLAFSPDWIQPYLNDLQDPIPWFILNGLPPTFASVGMLINLPAAQRAIYGLCSAEEWQPIWQDSSLRKHIIACRNGRNLYFKSM